MPSATLPAPLVAANSRPAVLADEVLVPASRAAMPEWLAYLQGRAAGFADAWAATTPYLSDDYVHHESNIYRALVDNQGITPGSPEDGENYWTMVLDASLGPPRAWLDTREIDERIRVLRPNPYTNADRQKMAGLEHGATADLTGEEIARLLEALAGADRLDHGALKNLPNELTDALLAKLNGLEDGATGDQTATEIVTLLETLTGDNRLDHSAISNVPRYKWRGDFAGTQTYFVGDIVVYGSHFYICRTDNHRSTVGPNGDDSNWYPVRDFRGTWTATWYQPGNIVKDAGDNQLYICLNARTGNDLNRPGTDLRNWAVISHHFVGQWRGGGTYQRGQIVWHTDHLWICRTNAHRSGTGPNGDSENWDPLTLYRGAWTPHYYEPGDMVTTPPDHNVYICVRSTTRPGNPNPPDVDTAHWRRLSNWTHVELDARIAPWARANDPTGTAPVERLGTGTPTSGNFLSGNGVWTDVPDEVWPEEWDATNIYPVGSKVRVDNGFWQARLRTTARPHANISLLDFDNQRQRL